MWRYLSVSNNWVLSFLLFQNTSKNFASDHKTYSSSSPTQKTLCPFTVKTKISEASAIHGKFAKSIFLSIPAQKHENENPQNTKENANAPTVASAVDKRTSAPALRSARRTNRRVLLTTQRQNQLSPVVSGCLLGVLSLVTVYWDHNSWFVLHQIARVFHRNTRHQPNQKYARNCSCTATTQASFKLLICLHDQPIQTCVSSFLWRFFFQHRLFFRIISLITYSRQMSVLSFSWPTNVSLSDFEDFFSTPTVLSRTTFLWSQTHPICSRRPCQVNGKGIFDDAVWLMLFVTNSSCYPGKLLCEL